ncbi:MAG: LysM peptidoglycan-binding domain-containing protein, partial [Bacteroidales bacterium]|nr:LysM peptidoglycan-binding domain-containing protein [Bacteroidales bacterium]
MKKVLTFIFSGILAVTALEFQCAAQNYVAPPVTVSSTTVERGGAVYYEHTVLAKQTLYSISRAYDVNIDEIYAANEGLKESGLKKGSVIYIPAKSSVGVSDSGSGVGSGVGSGDNGAKSASFSEENPANDAVSVEKST